MSDDDRITVTATRAQWDLVLDALDELCNQVAGWPDELRAIDDTVAIVHAAVATSEPT